MPNLVRFVLVATVAISAGPLAAQAVHLVGPGHWPTVQDGIDAAAPGDVVLVDAGVYPTFHVGKPLTITAVPSALVQVVGAAMVTFVLQPQDRVHLGGLDIQAAGVTIDGGIVAMERCTVRTDSGIAVSHAMLEMRWASSGGYQGSGVLLDDASLHASDCTFATLAGGVANIEYGAVKAVDGSSCELSSCLLFGAWPSDPATPWPSVALHVSRLTAAGLRVWLADCTLVGGFHGSGQVGPSLVAPAPSAPTPVRLHRGQLTGAVLGGVAVGRVVGLRTPVDMHVGGSFTTTMRGDPGDPLLLYVGNDILGEFPLPMLEQPALGFLDLVVLGAQVANAQGTVDFPFTVPNDPNLRHVVLWWRGLDFATYPWQGTPAFATIVQ